MDNVTHASTGTDAINRPQTTSAVESQERDESEKGSAADRQTSIIHNKSLLGASLLQTSTTNSGIISSEQLGNILAASAVEPRKAAPITASGDDPGVNMESKNPNTFSLASSDFHSGLCKNDMGEVINLSNRGQAQQAESSLADLFRNRDSGSDINVNEAVNFGKKENSLQPEEKIASQGSANPSGQRNWTAEEDNTLIASIRAGEELQILAEKVGRNEGGVRARMIRLVAMKRITDAERLTIINASHGPSYVPPSKWTAEEDRTLIRAIRDGKTAAQTSKMLPNRSEGAVLRRRPALVDMSQLRSSEVFAGTRTTTAMSQATPTIPQSKQTFQTQSWTDEEDRLLRVRIEEGKSWPDIASEMGNRSASSVSNRYLLLRSRNLCKEKSKETPRRKSSSPAQKTTPANIGGHAGSPWTDAEDQRLLSYVKQGMTWPQMHGLFGSRSVGSFGTRFHYLKQKGKAPSGVKASHVRRGSSSSAFSGTDEAGRDAVHSPGGDRPGMSGKPKRTIIPSRKRAHEEINTEVKSKDTIQAYRSAKEPNRSTQIARKTVDPHRTIPSPDHSDSDSDDEDNDSSRIHIPPPKRAKGPDSSRSRPAGGFIRGVSRPMSNVRLNARPGAHEHENRHVVAPDAKAVPRNSVDRLSGVFSGAGDHDTIYVSAITGANGQLGVNSEPAASQPNGRSRVRDHRDQFISLSTNGHGGAFQDRDRSSSPELQTQELDTALAAQAREIEVLKSTLAKHQQFARQSEEIKDLKKALARFDPRA